METRSIASKLNTEGRKISGYAIMFNAPARINERGRSFTEVIKPGALQFQNMHLYWNHNTDFPLGSTEAGTLSVTVDNIGLRFEATLPESATREAESIARGDTKGMSFKFVVNRAGEVWSGEQRKLTDITVREISITPEPAYPQTTVAIRSSNDMRLQLAEKIFLKK